MITIEQAKEIITIMNNAQLIANTTGISLTREEIRNQLSKVDMNMTGGEFKSIKNNIENFEIVKACRIYYTWMASGMFPNKMIYAPANTDLLIDAYNKKVK